MALYFSRKANELIQFRLRYTGQLVEVQARFIVAMSKIVQVGEKNAISVSKAFKIMGVTDTGPHQRQWRHAADYWQEQDVLVSATTKGYFIPANERERKRCVQFKRTTLEALRRRMHRLEQIPLGKGFPKVI